MNQNQNQSISAELARVQSEIKAPKGRTNTFGKYQYRSCEDILIAFKKVAQGTTLTLSDSIEIIGSRVYIKATATLYHGAESLAVSAFAREQSEKKGMDEAQITGSASSYARKYALCGLFLIDDNQDPDSDEATRPATLPAKNPFQAPAVPTYAPATTGLHVLNESDLIMKDYLTESGFSWDDLAKTINSMYQGKIKSWHGLSDRQKKAFCMSEKLALLESKITEAVRQ